MSYPGGDERSAGPARLVPWVLIGAATITACTATTDAADPVAAPIESAPPAASGDAPTSTTAVPTTTTPEPMTSSTTTSPSTTTTAPSTTTTTTTTLPELDVHDPACVVVAAMAGPLESVRSDVAGETIAGVDLWVENNLLRDGVAAGDLVDVCVGNGVDDVTGGPRVGRDDPIVGLVLVDDVKRQQEKLNELFAGLTIAPLDVDGLAGPRTRQRLCAARLALGIPASTTEMQPGTYEHATLFAADALPTPASTAIASPRWVLIDRTCQIMFVGEGRDLLYVFPTSTGTEGFETRDQDRTAAFRFNPAVENGGWHDSTEFPVGVDNPLNGNMYKPLYFDLGQAIHGANSVPAAPASKGCARLQVGHQNLLLGWLGLVDETASIWRVEEIQVTVNVQGAYVPR